MWNLTSLRARGTLFFSSQMESDLFTPDELAYDLWNGKLLDYQFETNKRWLNEVFRVLKIGGVWGYPDAKRAFKKINDIHFVEAEYQPPEWVLEEWV